MGMVDDSSLPRKTREFHNHHFDIVVPEFQVIPDRRIEVVVVKFPRLARQRPVVNHS